MKNQKKLLLIITCVLSIGLFSCTKSICKTCTLDYAPDIRVEVCADKATTYENNTVILESPLNGVPVASYTATLEISGYKCN